MANGQVPAGAPAPQPAPAAALEQQAGPEQALNMFNTLGKGLTEAARTLSETGAPRELLEPLQNAMAEYDRFLTMLTGQQQGQPPTGPQIDSGTQAAGAGGNPNAIPA